MSERVSIFAENEDFDVTGFAPKDSKPKPETPPEAVRAVAEKAQFRSREAAPAKKEAPKELRRYRTGRNVQLTLKVSQETADAFYAIANRENLILGVTLERAVAALERELTRK